jgi:hypothetical protein
MRRCVDTVAPPPAGHADAMSSRTVTVKPSMTRDANESVTPWTSPESKRPAAR